MVIRMVLVLNNTASCCALSRRTLEFRACTELVRLLHLHREDFSVLHDLFIIHARSWFFLIELALEDVDFFIESLELVIER